MYVPVVYAFLWLHRKDEAFQDQQSARNNAWSRRWATYHVSQYPHIAS